MVHRHLASPIENRERKHFKWVWVWRIVVAVLLLIIAMRVGHAQGLAPTLQGQTQEVITMLEKPPALTAEDQNKMLLLQRDALQIGYRIKQAEIDKVRAEAEIADINNKIDRLVSVLQDKYNAGRIWTFDNGFNWVQNITIPPKKEQDQKDQSVKKEDKPK